jgi:hypothetical protein
MIEPDIAFWKRKQAKSLKRKTNNRLVRDSFLIVCEGEKTEPNYFRSFRLTSSYVKDEILGIGDNTMSLVKKTVQYKLDAAKCGIKFDQIWCVFDKDDKDKDFDDACALAKREGIKIACSNECFELWYFLHYHFNTSRLKRTDYFKKLSVILGKRYEKNSEEMYSILNDKQSVAIQHATKLLDTHKPTDPPSLKNPSTTVHLLVNELNKFLAC